MIRNRAYNSLDNRKCEVNDSTTNILYTALLGNNDSKFKSCSALQIKSRSSPRENKEMQLQKWQRNARALAAKKSGYAWQNFV
jgi:hypothetical protein